MTTNSSAVQKQLLTGSTNGKGISVAATSDPGTTIHTAGANTTDIDEVWLWASNNHSASVVIHIQWGEVSQTAKEITMTIPFQAGLTLISPGLPINNGLIIKIWATSSADKVDIFGFVNRITIAG